MSSQVGVSRLEVERDVYGLFLLQDRTVEVLNILVYFCAMSPKAGVSNKGIIIIKLWVDK